MGSTIPESPMKPNIIHITDPDGRKVVGVLLSNRPLIAWLYIEDFERIAAQYPGNWSLVDARKPTSYVRVRKDDHSVYIARLVADAPAGSSICFNDSNTLNLRKRNLTFRAGDGGHSKPKWVTSLLTPLKTTLKTTETHS